MEDRASTNSLEKELGVSVIRRIAAGAEADVYMVRYHGVNAVLKVRCPKLYRSLDLDNRLRRNRTILEAKLIVRATEAGVNTPALLAVSPTHSSLLIELVKGDSLLTKGSSGLIRYSEQVGRLLGRMHKNMITHGDLTPSNIIVSGVQLFIIDFGLGDFTSTLEDKAVDVNLFLKIAETIAPQDSSRLRAQFRDGYIAETSKSHADAVFERLKEIRLRGRYIAERQLQ